MSRQEELRRKDQAKQKGMRDRAEERTSRFMNAHERTIGVNKAALDEQVREKNKKNLEEKQTNIDEGNYIEQLCAFQELEELRVRDDSKKELEDVKQTLLKQMKLPKNNAIRKDGPIDITSCGVASAQHFSGEDPQFDERKKLQQKQLQEWCKIQMEEMENASMKQAEQVESYAEYVRNEDTMRTIIAEEEEIAKMNVTKSIMMDNIKTAKEVRDKKAQDDAMEKKLKEAEVLHAISDPHLTEETEFSKNHSADHRFRPDHFKGFSEEQIKFMCKENDQVLREKQRLNDQNEIEEKEWAQYQADIVQALEAAEIERQQRVEYDNQIQADALKKQRLELKEKQERMRREKFGAIEEGFFQKFGRSCR